MLLPPSVRWPAAALLVVLLSGCAEEGPGSFEATRAPLATPNRADVADEIPVRGVPQVIGLTLAGGAVSGDTGDVAVVLNSPVRVTVLADVVDTVVIDGYDLTFLTTIGSAAQLEFVADRPGAFPVRLEDSGLVLATLQVG